MDWKPDIQETIEFIKDVHLVELNLLEMLIENVTITRDIESVGQFIDKAILANIDVRAASTM